MPRKLPLIATLAMGALVLSGCANSPAQASGAGQGTPGTAGPPSIVAHAQGKVTGTPDTVTLTLGVQTEGASAKAAMDANATKANALVDMLKGKGVAEKDLRTSQLSVNPTYGPSGGRISGYQVSNMVTATVHDIGAAGGIIDAAGAAAGDAVRVQGLSFSIADDSTLRAQARADAVKQAQAQAKQLADAAGVALGKVRTISEAVAPTTPQPYPAYDLASGAGRAQAPIQPGTQELQVTVDVVYDIG